MIKTLLQKYNIDSRQLMTLFRIGIKMDFRPNSKAADGIKQNGIIINIVMFGLFSTIISMACISIPDAYTYFFFVLTYAMMMMALSVMVEYYSIAVHPDDYDILGHQPISSNTFFISKLLNIGFYITILTSALCLIPVIVYVFKAGLMFFMLPLVFLTCLLAGLGVSFFIIFIYVYLMSRFQQEKIQSFIGYLQMVFSMGFYFGYQYIMGSYFRHMSAGFTLKDNLFLWLTPMAWYAGLCELLLGNLAISNLLLAVIALSVTGLFIYLGMKRIGQHYQESLGEQHIVQRETISTQEKPSLAHQISSFFRDPDIKSGFILTSLYLKRDRKLKMGIFPIIGMLAYFLSMMYFGQFKSSGLVDFLSAEGNHDFSAISSNIMVYVFLPFLFATLISVIGGNEDWQASWIYYSTPINPLRFYQGAKIALYVWVMIPLFILITMIYAWKMPLLHAIPQTLTVILLGVLFGTMTHIFSGDLPFSVPSRQQGISGNIFLMNMLSFFMSAICVFIQIFAFRYFWGIIIFYTILIAAVVLVNHLDNQSVLHKHSKSEYAG